MGRNQWRDEASWPLDRAVETKFYLHSEGNVRGAWVRGGLSTVPPRDEPPDRFTYDPSNPVPSWGGANCGPSGALPMRRGPRDQQIALYRLPRFGATFALDPASGAAARGLGALGSAEE